MYCGTFFCCCCCSSVSLHEVRDILLKGHVMRIICDVKDVVIVKAREA